MAISKRKKKDGTTVYDVRVFMGYRHDGKPDRRSITCATLRHAKSAEAKLIAEKDAMRGKSGRMSLETFITKYYWPSASQRLAATSKDTYLREIRKRIIPNLGNMDIRDIDRKMIQRAVSKCETETVARKMLGVLKTILNEAKADGVVLSNAAESRFVLPEKGEKRDNGLVLVNFEQIADFLNTVREKGSQTVQRISYTGLLLGLRPEERYALDWSDFDLESKTVSITSAYVAASSEHGGNQEKGTKTEKGTRILPLPPDFVEWLKDIPRGGGAFIVGANGERISPSTAQKRWRRFLDENPDLPRITIENMRHSFATSFLAAGGRVETLSRILGHANISTTMNRYVRPDISSLRDEMDSLNIAKIEPMEKRTT